MFRIDNLSLDYYLENVMCSIVQDKDVQVSVCKMVKMVSGIDKVVVNLLII